MSKYIPIESLYAALDLIEKSAVKGEEEKVRCITKAIRDINFVPAADVVEVRHGKWLQEEYIDGEWYHTCSSCGMSLKKDAFDNFCGNCGTKMDEVEE